MGIVVNVLTVRLGKQSDRSGEAALFRDFIVLHNSTCWIPQSTILSDVRDIRCYVCKHCSSLLFRVGQLWITPGLTACNIHKLVSLKIRKSAHFFSLLGVQSPCSEWQAHSVGASVQKLKEIVPVRI